MSEFDKYKNWPFGGGAHKDSMYKESMLKLQEEGVIQQQAYYDQQLKQSRNQHEAEMRRLENNHKEQMRHLKSSHAEQMRSAKRTGNITLLAFFVALITLIVTVLFK